VTPGKIAGVFCVPSEQFAPKCNFLSIR
jgi:hypothetical protein